VSEKEEREEEDERERKKRERRSERSERMQRVTTLWRGVKNTSTEKRENAESDHAVEGSEEYFDESEHVDGSLKRSVLQTARMGLVRRWMRFRE